MSSEKKPRISLPVVVEGKYDKIKLTSVFSADVFVTCGFGIFNSEEKRQLIRRIAKDKGIIILTDSDGGGRQIRSFLSGILPADKIHQLYIPEIPGTERRKKQPSKSGMLGVEGMSRETLMSIFRNYITDTDVPFVEGPGLSSAEMYELGLSGVEGSSALRDKLAESLLLPKGMSAKAFLAAVNLTVTRDEWSKIIEEYTASGS
jgi:ribonuclease M5